MPAAFVQQVQQWSYTDSSLTENISLAAGIAAGDFIVIPWENASDNVNVLAGVTDSSGNTYSLTTPSTSGTGYSCGFAYAVADVALAASDTITLTWTNTNFHYKFGTILEFSGVGALDSQAVVADTFTASAVSLALTTTAPALVVGLVAQQHNQTYTVGGSFTNAANQSYGPPSRSDYLYRIVSAGGSYNPAGTIGAADNYRGAIVAFRSATPTFLSRGTADEAGGPTTLAPSYPASIAADDGLVLHVTMQTGSPSCSTPSGWTAHPDNPKTVGSFSSYLFYRKATGSESGTLSITGLPASTGKAAVIDRYDTVTGFEAGSSATGSSTTVADVGMTTAGDNRLAAQYVAVNDSGALAAFAGETGGDWTEATAETGASFGFVQQVQTAEMGSAGTIDGGTATIASAGWIVFALALRNSALVPTVGKGPFMYGGACAAGRTMYCDVGDWANSPSSYAYQWQAAGVDITGETAASYVLQAGDVGDDIRCEVIATNTDGDSSPAYTPAVECTAAGTATTAGVGRRIRSAWTGGYAE